MNQIEVRMNQSKLTPDTDGELIVSGYVNKTGQKSEVLGSSKRFVEKISKGAFSKAIKNSNHDIDFLAEHNPKKILSSTRNKSLILREDSEGLYMKAQIVPTSWGKDIHELITSGIYRNMSFGFRVLKDSWDKISNDLYERTIHELELMEVSVVKNPAYVQSSISARGIDVIEDVVPQNISKNIKENEKYMKAEERIYGINKDSMEAEKRKSDFEDFKEFLLENRNLSMTVDGRATVPESVADIIVQKIGDNSPVFEMAKKIPSQSGTVKIPFETDLMEAGFVGEGNEILEGKINLSEVKLEQKRVGASIQLTNQLINDSAINLVDYAGSLLARQVAKAIEKSMLVGKGGTEFRGITNEELQSVEVSGSIESINMDNLLDMYNAVHPSYHRESAYIVSKNAFLHVSKLRDGNGHMFIQNGIVNGKPTRTLFGAPVFISDSLSDETPIVFGNFGEGVSVMIKQSQGLQLVTDTKSALRGLKMILLDLYIDSVVSNPQALSKLTVTA